MVHNSYWHPVKLRLRPNVDIKTNLFARTLGIKSRNCKKKKKAKIITISIKPRLMQAQEHQLHRKNLQKIKLHKSRFSYVNTWLHSLRFSPGQILSSHSLGGWWETCSATKVTFLLSVAVVELSLLLSVVLLSGFNELATCHEQRNVSPSMGL